MRALACTSFSVAGMALATSATDWRAVLLGVALLAFGVALLTER